MKITGVADFERYLRQLTQREAKKAVLTGLRAGARVIATQARKNVKANPSVDSGLLSKSITSKANKGKVKGGEAGAFVYVRSNKQSVVRKGRKKAMLANPQPYAHLVELGTQHSPAEPFLRPAIDQKGDEAVAKVEQALDRAIRKLRL